MNCTESQPLISSYLDAELSDELAGRLRKHLLDCHHCRMAAQDEKSFKEWFVRPAEVAVPSDFAARVARRAFAGDTGQERDVTLTPAAAPEREAPILRFALRATAAAAAVVFALSIAIGTLDKPGGTNVMADDPGEALTTEQIIQKAEAMNEQEPEALEESSER
ncbi:MAG: zf-HC2 domain-containing protein [Planctomycetota bacterium]